MNEIRIFDGLQDHVYFGFYTKFSEKCLFV